MRQNRKNRKSAFRINLIISIAMFGLLCGPVLAYDVYLVAKEFTLTLPDGVTTVPMWGFALDADSDLSTDGGELATVPGPRIDVPSGEAILNIHLRNDLSVPVSIVIPGQIAAMVPVWDDGSSGARPNADSTVRSFTHETPPSGGISTYFWPNFTNGTCLYYSGTDCAVQMQMGLYGCVIKNLTDTAPPIVGTGPQIIVDNLDSANTAKTGSWPTSSGANPYAANSVYSRNGSTFTFTADVTGQALLHFWFTWSSTRSGSVPVEVYDGTTLLDTLSVDQSIQANAGMWKQIGGPYNFTGQANIKIIAQGGSSTCADAIGLEMAVTGGGGAGEAYPNVVYDNEVLICYSEIDPVLHDAIATGNYGAGMAITSTVNYKPTYFLVNGRPYTSGDPPIPAGNPGESTLLRFVNAGFQSHCPIFQDFYAGIVAEDGKPYTYMKQQYTMELAASKTCDALWTPQGPGTYPVWDRMLALANNDNSTGGLTAMLAVGPATGNIAPTINAVTATPSTILDTATSQLLVNAIDTDAGPSPLTYNWIVQAGQGSVNDATITNPVYTPPNVSTTQIFTITIEVFDGQDTTTDTVNVTVEDDVVTGFFSEDFNAGPDGFGYVDDPFRGTGQPSYADGSYLPSGGNTGGGLYVTLGGINNNAILGMSGGWQRTFTVASPTYVRLSFLYNMIAAGGFETDEYSEVLVTINGTLFGTGAQEYVARIDGDGNTGPDLSTGWQTFETDLGMLPADTYTLVIGIYNNKKTAADETTELFIDDVSAVPATPPVFLIDEDFNAGTGTFAYSDDTFRGTSAPTYADGIRVASGGFTGGALQVSLGDADDVDVFGLSGGWQKVFNLASSGNVTLSFRYNLTIAEFYEADEFSEVLVSVDGTLYGASTNDYVDSLTGDNNGVTPLTTGWQIFEIDLGTVASGNHTVIIGCYNNKKTFNNELTEVLIDDVLVTTP